MDEIKILEDGVRTYAPVVAEKLACEDTIADYARKLYNYSPNPVHVDRQKLAVTHINHYIARVFKSEYKVTSPLISNIVDHQTILNHPILVTTNLIANAHRLIDGTANKEPIVVLTSSIVPLDNFFNKGGFQFIGKKVPLLSNKYIHQSVCFMDKQKFAFANRLPDEDFLAEMEHDLNALDYATVEDFNDQMSVADQYLWKRLFASEIRDTVPELFYVPTEKIFRNLLPEMFSDRNSIIYRALFESTFRERALKEFDGVTGCWSKVGKGTHFFWHPSEKNEAERMELRGNMLVAVKSNFSVELTPQALEPLVREGTLVPGLFVMYGYLCFWAGLKPLTGYGSSAYMTRMKEAWLRALAGVDEDERARIENLDTKSLIGGSIGTYARVDGNVTPQYAFEVIARGGMGRVYLEHLFAMKLNDLLRPALLDVYESYVPQAERVKLNVKASDLMGTAFDWIK